MLQGEHSAILSTFTKLPFVIKFFVLSILEWPFYTVTRKHPELNVFGEIVHALTCVAYAIRTKLTRIDP